MPAGVGSLGRSSESGVGKGRLEGKDLWYPQEMGAEGREGG